MTDGVAAIYLNVVDEKLGAIAADLSRVPRNVAAEAQIPIGFFIAPAEGVNVQRIYKRELETASNS